MLSDYRILDLTDEGGLIAGMILADLGADVIAVEPPQGNSARRRGPFAGDPSDIEGSLTWQAWARNKRSAVIDLETDAGRAQFRRLAATADALIESDAVGAMAARGLGYDDLAALNPGLVYAAVTPFGSSGPKAEWAATDLTIAAAAGPMAQSGDADRAPLRVSLPQTGLHAGAEAAAAVQIALWERKRSGRGQFIDVSAQAAHAQATQSGILAAPLNSPSFMRSAKGAKLGPLEVQLFWPCKDGHAAITYLFGAAIGPFTRRLMEWVYEEGRCDEATRDKDWLNYTLLLLSGREPISEYFRLLQVVESLTMTKTKAELFEEALKRRLLIVPVSTMADLDSNEHLAVRGYWREVERGGRRLRFPGPFARFSSTPIEYRRAAPLLGEHTAEVLSGEMPSERERRPAASLHGSGGEASPPLEGLKMLDLMWVMAGPAGTRTLADFGVQTVRVESSTRIDTARTLQPFVNDDSTQADGSGLFQNMNANKLMTTVDPANPAGRGLLLDLVRWADILTESFTPRAMRGWGLTWEELHAVNPRLIMLSSCLMGQTGPLAEFAGFGNLAAAFAGFTPLCSWPDRSPAGPFGAYTDYVAPRFATAALLAALEQRERSGVGQYIDVSQLEAGIHFLTPAFLQYGCSDSPAGRVWKSDGNRDPQIAPHGVYPSSGEDQWVAVAAADDAQWSALAAVLGGGLAADERFASPAGRLAAQDELDAAVSAWSGQRSPGAATEALQAAGVAAHAVQNSPELAADPQLAHRRHFVPLTHASLGASTVEGARFLLSRTPARRPTAAPLMGADNDTVLRAVLGYDDEQIAAIAASGALQ